jgi:hypothetical protein
MSDDTALGDHLATLSLQVAEQVDRKLNGKNADSTVFANFSRELSRASGLGEPNSTAFLHADPMTTEVFAQAIRESSREPLSDLASLGLALTKIIRPLSENEEGIPDHVLGLLKAFCLSLHKSMMAQRLPPLHEGERWFEDEIRFAR